MPLLIASPSAERPLPALPLDHSFPSRQATSVHESKSKQHLSQRRNKSETYVEGLIRTLEGLQHLDLYGRVAYDAEYGYLAGGAYGDIRVGTCRLDARGEVKVAVKCLRLYLCDSPDVTKLVEREVRVWSRLDHANILPLLGYITEPHGLPALVSEFMENGTVLKYFQVHPESDKMHMILGIAEGVAYLHQLGVIHSDIKSDNVLVSNTGDALICDFGISRLMSGSQTIGERAVQVQSSTMRGSTRWMSPELLLPSGEHVTYSEASDIWAFGMTVYEIITMKRPFYHLACDPQVITAIIYGDRPKPSFSWEVGHQQLWNICLDCWVEDARLRPSVAEILLILKTLRLSSELTLTIDREKLPRERKIQNRRKGRYNTFQDMGIRAQRLEEDKKCVIQ